MSKDPSLSALGFLTKATDSVNSSLTKLGSGRRINSSKDDAAGNAISSIIDAVVVTLSQASRNTADASSALQIADSAIASIGDIRIRQTELAAAAANGTNSPENLNVIQLEFDQLSQEADRIVATTEFNGTKLLQGSSSTIQVGTDSSADSQITTPSISVSSTSGLSTATQASARLALDSINQSIASIAQVRGTLGATENRLEVTSKNISSSQENLSASSSRIKDLDVGEESSNLVRNTTLQKAGVATLQQINKSKQNTLKLLA